MKKIFQFYPFIRPNNVIAYSFVCSFFIHQVIHTSFIDMLQCLQLDATESSSEYACLVIARIPTA